MTFSYGWIYFGIYSSLELIVFICGLVILRRSTIKETIVTTAIGVIAAMILNMILPFYWDKAAPNNEISRRPTGGAIEQEIICDFLLDNFSG